MASPPTAVALRSPSKYTPAPPATFSAPPVDWLLRTWTVTHSTLAMWRDARNVRISYAALDPKPDGTARVDDLVEYESNKTAAGGVKSVKGVDTASQAGDTSAWDWRGKGWLFFVGSHWEVLGWGEREVAGGARERWVVTWFAPTLFTKEGVDVYCDRKEGLSEEGYKEVLEGLKGLEATDVVQMVEKDMRPVEISLPWKET
ncbi:hypothetical protein ColTof4_09171 [Colletotrichum tofieldiae]|uniref:Histidinolphosphatase-like protein n=1 Tax=Colletotrichum tofieldiae TaxID=708197 RepID=A0A166XRC3_9PEZI|nr:hypothetical protein CT0861_03326 [Colletotrichum tofieldiae]GKT56282.1 hypothetical protein ColTof3_03621 [Colletotrichum tofieldiae]GKT76748.1 hypothetical protein ColTof4_09171 [Colletotrichum tofieldiae]